MTGARGNVLFFILIALALFAALLFATTRSDQGPVTIQKEKDIIAAGQITEYAHAVQSAVLRLRVSNGCRDEQMSFENPVVSGYVNPLSPTSKSCNVFDQAGGGISFQAPPPATGIDLDYEFNGANIFYDIGTPDSELAMFLPLNSLDLCLQINKALGLPVNLAIDWIDNAKFTGSYGSANGIPDEGGNIAGFRAVWSACLQAKNGATNYPQSAGANYFFYHILIPR